MRFWRRATVSLAWTLMAAATLARAESGRYALDRWNTDAGLPQNSVNAIIQSRDGYLWVATYGGVARFDGTAFTSLSTDRVGGVAGRALALAEDRLGRIWIGTEEGLFRHEKGTITSLDTTKGMPGNHVRAIAAHGDGSVWFGTNDGALGRVDGDRVTTVVAPRSLLSSPVIKVLTDEKGAVWVLSANGVWRLDAPFEAPVLVRPRLAAAIVQGALAVDPNRGTWMVTDTGLRRVSEEGVRDFDLPEKSGLRPVQIRVLALDGPGNVWIGAAGGDIWKYEPDTGSLRQITDIGQMGTQALIVDREGSVWVGNRVAGLARVRPLLFQVITTEDGLAHDNTRGLFEDSKGRVWVAADCAGVAMREAGAETFRRIEGPGIPGCVWTIAEDARGDIWLGGKGVARYRNGKAQDFLGKEGWPTTNVRVLFKDRRGTIWVGGSFGLASVDGEQLRPLLGRGPIRPRSVTGIHESADGTLWIATNVGLLRYRNGDFQSYGRAEGLPDTDVRAIYEDKKGALWIGTYGGGLTRFANGRFHTFTTADGLRDSFLSSITEDAEGNLWLSGDRGVTRVPRIQLEQRADGSGRPAHALSYGRADGMLSAETNGAFQGAFARIGGKLWYPTLVGVAIIDPKTALDPVPPAVSIDGIRVNGQVHDPRDGLSIGPGAVDVEFSYSGLSLKAPQAVTFRHRLEGWDTDWIDASTRRSANYSRLTPGDYRFTVLAANRDGVWTPPGPSLSFRVLPQYWQTWWFRALALMAVAALPLLRGRHLRRRRAELEALVAARTNQLGEAVARLSVSEQQALRAKDEALAASRAKSIFLANMSHELRTPLNAVIGFAQVLSRRDSFRGEDRESLRIIQRSGEHLLGLINDVLSLSKIEAGALTLHERAFDLTALIESVRAMTSARAEAKGLEVVFAIEPGLPRVVMGDEGRLRQVLINLLGNAVKFTGQGNVTLRVQYRDGRASFAVADTGHGIAEVEIPKLFGAFVQTESGEISREGTGLGLAISAQIVKLMGGEIRVQSRVGQGSVFTFEIPLRAAGEASPQKPARQIVGLYPGQSPVRILVVDDTEENRLLLKQVLSSTGFLVEEASDGEQAVERFEAQRPALILMDARMKVMDGREATRRIREIEMREGGPRTVIIALTAGAFEHEREQMFEAGADQFVAKPFHLETVLETIGSALGLVYAFAEPEKTVGSSTSSTGPLAPERLALLSAELRRELHEALSEGHVQRARVAAERIRAEDEALGSALLSEIRAFRLDELLELIQETSGRRGR